MKDGQMDNIQLNHQIYYHLLYVSIHIFSKHGINAVESLSEYTVRSIDKED